MMSQGCVCLACCLVQCLAQSGCSGFQKYILNNEQIKWRVPTSPCILSSLYFYPQHASYLIHYVYLCTWQLLILPTGCKLYEDGLFTSLRSELLHSLYVHRPQKSESYLACAQQIVFFLNDQFVVCYIQNTDNGVGQLQRYCHGKHIMYILVAQIRSRQERVFMLKQILKTNCKSKTKDLSILKKILKFQHASFNSQFCSIF